MARAVTLSANTARWMFGSLAVARILLGLIFLWAFFDKLCGLGFSTCRNPKTNIVHTACAQSWIHGGSPTTGFLTHATGPFAAFYHNLAGLAWVDWLFMIGLLGIGLSLLLGIAVRLGTLTGSVLLLLMWSAGLWPQTNPIIDEHLVYILVLVMVGVTAKQQMYSVAAWWRTMPLVNRTPWLQ